MLDNYDHYNDEQLQALSGISNKRRRYKRRGSRCPSMLATSIAESIDDCGIDGGTLSSTTSPALFRSHSNRELGKKTSETASFLFGNSHATTSIEGVFDALLLPVSNARRSPSKLLSEALSVLEIHRTSTSTSTSTTSTKRNSNSNRNSASTECGTKKRFSPSSHSEMTSSVPDCLMRLPDENNVVYANRVSNDGDPALAIVHQALGLTKMGVMGME
eukprot:CAMPEP_0172384942 /NCGR_PEP_ID=MMETSP1061-20121228/2619_1 /TAXON_ID=37318 /ORGANISM="Pseudo-nitzschia pungens, Strain cf. pungens" /LENGTH=216 /DNA_ID=CAMNT_0013113733 /DNA_START=189 /DNA_END=839 /DNA_ORIENTATION=-